MYFFLRIILTALFLTLGTLILIYPIEASYYIALRYEGMQRFALSTLSLQLPGKLTLGPFWQLLAFCGFALGAAVVVARSQLGIMMYALLTVIIGGFLHLPYTNIGLKDIGISQIRKLVCVFIIFASLTILASQGKKLNKISIASEPTAVCIDSPLKSSEKKDDSPSKGQQEVKEKPKGE